MLIGIDGNEANVRRRVGIGEYAYQLVTGFAKHAASTSSFQVYIKGEPVDLPPESSSWHYKEVGPARLWTQFGLPVNLYTSKPRPDIFFTPSHYAPRFSPIPTAISIMDLSYIHFPELFAKNDLFQLTKWTAYSAKQAAKIFTISQASKNDILTYYHVKDENVIVTYPGIKLIKKQELVAMATLQKKYNLPEKYILFVGTIQPRKNIARLIEAFTEVIKKHPDVSLIIAGKKGWLYEAILAAPRKFGITDNVMFLDFVAEDDLASLYQHAICYVLPSLYEGFGLPVLEAMQYGCPVITSNVSSLPEAGGDAALYVDPKDPTDIAAKIIMVIENKKMREVLIEKGYAHIKKFSWEKTAKETLQVLEGMK